jgi:hypothetical protein
MGVPARHRERSGEADGPPATVPRYCGIDPEAYLNGTSQGATPEDAWKDVHIHGRSKLFMKYLG